MRKRQPKRTQANARTEAHVPSETSPPPVIDIPGACLLFRQVGVLANTALQITFDPATGDVDPDQLQDRIQLMKLMLDRIGWVADVGLRHLGEPGNFARAEDWMLPAAG